MIDPSHSFHVVFAKGTTQRPHWIGESSVRRRQRSDPVFLSDPSEGDNATTPTFRERRGKRKDPIGRKVPREGDNAKTPCLIAIAA